MKKLLISIMSICCMFLNVFNVSAFEKSSQKINPLGISFPCEYCLVGSTQRLFNQREILTAYVSSCAHGIPGNEDVHEIIELYTIDKCLKCGAVNSKFKTGQIDNIVACRIKINT